MTAIVGGQTIPGSLQYNSTVTVNLSQNQGWTVPAGTYFEGLIFSSTTGNYLTIGGSENYGAYYYPYTSSDRGGSNVTFGGGTTLTARNGGWIVLRGILKSNT